MTEYRYDSGDMDRLDDSEVFSDSAELLIDRSRTRRYQFDTAVFTL